MGGLEVWSARYGARDPDWFDVTRVGCDRAIAEGRAAPGEAFAPSPDLLWPAKNRLSALAAQHVAGRLVETEYEARVREVAADYARAYKAELRLSYRARRPEWQALLARKRVVLVCFCQRPEACHRSILGQVLEACGAVYRGELPTIRAISVRQPWAWAILHARKDVENRGPSWGRSAPGPALVHAARGCGREEYEDAANFIRAVGGVRVPLLEELPRGALVGRADVVGVVRGAKPIEARPWFFGPVGLLLAGQEPREPVPCAGALGWFEVSRHFVRNWPEGAPTREHAGCDRPPPDLGTAGFAGKSQSQRESDAAHGDPARGPGAASDGASGLGPARAEREHG